jgi:hypothetical protein
MEPMLWDYSTGDTTRDPNVVMWRGRRWRAKSSTGEAQGVVLAHDTIPLWTRALGPLIESSLARGIGFSVICQERQIDYGFLPSVESGVFAP